MELSKFSKEILNKDIPLLTLKLIIYMISSDQNDITIDEACASMYCNKRKLINEIKGFKPIDGFLNIKIEEEGYHFEACGIKFEVSDVKKKKKSKKEKETAIIISNKDDAIKIVFDYWVLVMNKTSRSTLDSKRRKEISKALENLTIEQCKLAILGCSKTLWNMGKDPKNTTLYNSLNLIFRNQDKIETFILNADKPSIEEQLNLAPKSNKIEDRLNDNDWFEQRAGMVSGDMSNLRANVEKQNTSPQIESKEQLLVENKKSNTNILININGLIEKSEKAFYSFSETELLSEQENFRKVDVRFNDLNNSDIIDAEIIEEETLDDVPFYLQVSQNKEN